MRKVGSKYKVNTGITLATELREQGQPVVIFTEFVDSAKALYTALGGELLTGETPVAERQEIVDRFQNGESLVFTGTIKAGGVGLTLTAASNVILLDRPWTPGEMEQAEDRCIVEGQKVLTINGYKCIEAIKIGEKVLTHKGQWQQVTKTNSREHKELITEISYIRGCHPLRCTSDHKILVRKKGAITPEWIEAESALPGDCLLFPRLKRNNQVEFVSASETLASQMMTLLAGLEMNVTYRSITHPTSKNQHHIVSYTVNPKADNQLLNEVNPEYSLCPIREVKTGYAKKDTNGKYPRVYDLTVAEDHSFVVGLASVHNCHRIGAKDTVNSIWIQLGKIDETIDELIKSKAKRIELVLRGKRKTLRGLDKPAELAKELLTIL